MEDRNINELIISICQKYIHPQTGFIHFCYQPKESNYDVTIPLYENLLYVYTLFKTKIIEKIQEAKELLSALLYFQNIELKNFPVYLHEYPKCNNPYLPLKILPPLIFILKQFNSVLGEEILEKLKLSILYLIETCLKFFNEDSLKIEHKILLIASILSTKDFILIEADVNRIIDSIEINEIEKKFFNPQIIGDILTAFQIHKPLLERFPLDCFQFYSSKLGAYVGPALQIPYYKNQPQPTLFDYHCASIYRTYSKRLLTEDISLLYATLIQPYKEKFVDNEFIRLSGELNFYKWNYFCSSYYCCASIDMPLKKEISNWKLMAPLYLTWGDLSFIHSFVLQGGNYQTIKTIIEKDFIELTVELAEEFDLEDKEKKNELIFWLNKHPETKILVEDQKATTFKIENKIHVIAEKINFVISFTILEGDVQMLGHIMPGNRPSQIYNMNKNHYETFDWQILLRTLRRSSIKNVIQIKIQILNEIH